jgi:hypothetical protein
MPRRHRDNESVRAVNRERLEGAKVMARLKREARTTTVGRAMQDARRRAGLDDA